MSGTETRLRQLLEEATGEPPNIIAMSEVRRLARLRRTRHGTAAVSAAAACGAVLSVLALGLAAPLFGHSPSPRSVSSGQAGVPRYYLQEQSGTAGSVRAALVRDTATGTVTATVRCPWGSLISGIAPTADEAFYIACEQTRGSSDHIPVVVGTRLYRFEVTSTGSVPGYSLVPGGTLPGRATYGLTAAANGSEIALNTSTGSPPRRAIGVLVVNTSTGAHALWHERGSGFIPSDFTLSPDGRDLRFVLLSLRAVYRDNAEVAQVSPASRGGLLSSAHVLAHLAGQLGLFPYAQVSRDGSVLTIAELRLSTHSSTMIIEQLSVATGRVIRVLFLASFPRTFAFGGSASSDPSGRYLILTYGPSPSPSVGWLNGWLDHGRLAPLAPAHAKTMPGYETW
jgi:hypothetical protein